MDIKKMGENKTRKIYAKFIEKNITSYALLLLLTIFSELGVLYMVYRLNNFLKMGFLSENKNIQIIILTGIAVIVAVCKLLKAHFDFKLSNQGLIFLENYHLNHLLHCKYEHISNLNKIELTQQINNDCVVVSDFYTSKLTSLFVNIFKIILIVYMIANLSSVAIIILTVLVLVYILLYFATRTIYQEKNLEMLKAQQGYFSVLGGELLNVFLVKANSWYKQALSKFEEAGDTFVAKSVKFLDFDFFISNFLEIISLIILILFPVLLLQNGEDIDTIFIVIILSQLFINSFNTVFGIMKNINKNNVSTNRLNNLLAMELDNNGSLRADSIDTIELSDIYFSYKSDRNIFENQSFAFEKGKIYIVRGSNGSGKSTLIKLILGILEASKGKFLINNQDCYSFDMEELRKKNIAICEQEPYLVKGTILENLNYGLDNPKSSDFYRNNPLLSFVNQLPLGFDTVINYNSSNISGGQKQRIGLARTIAKDFSDVYIFDEPTSAMDSEGLAIFMEMINRMKDDNIIIVVSHKDEFSKIADYVYELSFNTANGLYRSIQHNF